MQDWRLEM